MIEHVFTVCIFCARFMVLRPTSPQSSPWPWAWWTLFQSQTFPLQLDHLHGPEKNFLYRPIMFYLYHFLIFWNISKHVRPNLKKQGTQHDSTWLKWADFSFNDFPQLHTQRKAEITYTMCRNYAKVRKMIDLKGAKSQAYGVHQCSDAMICHDVSDVVRSC